MSGEKRISGARKLVQEGRAHEGAQALEGPAVANGQGVGSEPENGCRFLFGGLLDASKKDDFPILGGKGPKGLGEAIVQLRSRGARDDAGGARGQVVRDLGRAHVTATAAEVPLEEVAVGVEERGAEEADQGRRRVSVVDPQIRELRQGDGPDVLDEVVGVVHVAQPTSESIARLSEQQRREPLDQPRLTRSIPAASASHVHGRGVGFVGVHRAESNPVIDREYAS